jgi:hypothetical protein
MRTNQNLQERNLQKSNSNRIALQKQFPKIAENSFLARNPVIVGDVEI